MRENSNPYNTYEDTHAHRPSGVNRGYFFGPGLHQSQEIWSAAYKRLYEEEEAISDWRKRNLTSSLITNVLLHIFTVAASSCIYIFGSVWIFAFCIILSVVLALGWMFFFCCFAFLWISDRAALVLNSIQSRCPNCKSISIVPLFQCPNCGRIHENLTPGPYGIFHVKCSCGKLLPSTAFNGRNDLAAFCPNCRYPLASGYAEQFGIQLAGSTSAGKTTFLAAFFHNYKEILPAKVKCKFYPEDEFSKLENLYSRGLSKSTTDNNALMYSIVHEIPYQTPHQLSFYDIAGEAFQNISSGTGQQQQFSYNEGIILIVDPDNDPDVNSASIEAFISEHKKLKGLKPSVMSSTPAALVITKADKFLREFDRGLQDETTCKNFLKIHGFNNIINLIETEFKTVKFFAVSAVGHELNGKSYEPRGVNEPVFWLLEQGKSIIFQLIKTGNASSNFFTFIFGKIKLFVTPVLLLTLVTCGLINVPYANIGAGIKSFFMPPLPPEEHRISGNNRPTGNEQNVQTSRQSAPKPAPKPEPEQQTPQIIPASTRGTNINVRTKPTITSQAITRLSEGVPVEITGARKVNNETWCFVKLPDNRKGWIIADYLQDRLASRGEHGGNFMSIEGKSVSLRSEPSTKAGIVSVLNTGNLVEVVETRRVRKDLWYHVYTQDNKTGWVFGKYVVSRKNL